MDNVLAFLYNEHNRTTREWLGRIASNCQWPLQVGIILIKKISSKLVTYNSRIVYLLMQIRC